MGISDEPPLIPTVDAILVMDGDGNRLAGKYYNHFLSAAAGDSSSSENPLPPNEQPAEMRQRTSDLRQAFERQVHSKIHNLVARSDAAEVVGGFAGGKTVVFCGGAPSNGGGGNGGGMNGAAGGGVGGAPSGGDVRVVMVGPHGESELVMAHFCESMFEALSLLMSGITERGMVLDNLELVLLLIDELCDGGLILESDPHKLVSSVVLRDENEYQDGMGVGGPGTGQGGMDQGGMNTMGANSMMGGSGELTMMQAFRQARDQLVTNLSQNGM